MSYASTKYEKTGLLYVDMVAACVDFYEQRKWATRKALKTIYLHPKGFDQFRDWALYQMPEDQRDLHVEQFTFNGVEVKLNSQLMGEQIYYDFNEEKTVIN